MVEKIRRGSGGREDISPSTIANKIDEIITFETIRLGQVSVTHVTATPTTYVGTASINNAAAFYTPTRNMKIKKIYFLTNITDAALTSSSRGTLTVSSVGATQEDTSIALRNIATSSDTSLGYGTSLNFTKDCLAAVILNGLTSKYYFTIALDALLGSDTYYFEVYIDVEYV